MGAFRCEAHGAWMLTAGLESEGLQFLPDSYRELLGCIDSEYHATRAHGG